MKSMMKKFIQPLFALLFVIIHLAAFAQESKGCPQVEILASNGQAFVFWEREFENGAHDLVISKLDQSDIKRVTYSGNHNLKQPDTCTYKALAIAQGGDWGWHLAWTFNNKSGVFYSRMDGLAWVSTPPKNIDQGHIDQYGLDTLKFELNNEQVILRGYNNQSSESAVFQRISEDEGRNW